VTNVPSLLGASGSLGTALFRWLNSRTVTTRIAPAGLDVEVQKMLEAIYTVASSPDVTPEMVMDLSNMAAASVIGHANRVKAASLMSRVEVLPAPGADIGKLIEILQKAEAKS
jgi:dTDP-4-dehydrorhamnose reductase